MYGVSNIVSSRPYVTLFDLQMQSPRAFAELIAWIRTGVKLQHAKDSVFHRKGTKLAIIVYGDSEPSVKTYGLKEIMVKQTVQKEPQVPYQALKQRTVMQQVRVPFWKAKKSYTTSEIVPTRPAYIRCTNTYGYTFNYPSSFKDLRAPELELLVRKHIPKEVAPDIELEIILGEYVNKFNAIYTAYFSLINTYPEAKIQDLVDADQLTCSGSRFKRFQLTFLRL